MGELLIFLFLSWNFQITGMNGWHHMVLPGFAGIIIMYANVLGCNFMNYLKGDKRGSLRNMHILADFK